MLTYSKDILDHYNERQLAFIDRAFNAWRRLKEPVRPAIRLLCVDRIVRIEKKGDCWLVTIDRNSVWDQ